MLTSAGPCHQNLLISRTVSAVCWLTLAAGWQHRAGAADAPSHTLTVEARDLVTDSAVSDVVIRMSVAGGAKLEATTNANGIARFEYALPEPTSRRFFSVTTGGDGLVPLGFRWLPQSSSPAPPEPPEHLLFQTEKATTLRGRVLDQEGQPLAGSTVVVSVRKKYSKTKQWVAISYDSTKTDAEGRWRFTNVPQQPDSVEIAAYHYLCLPDRPYFHLKPFEPLSGLRDGSAVLRLDRGTRIEGLVLAPDGRPVANADVFYGQGGRTVNAIPPATTDDQGKFTLGIKPGTASALIARAPGFGPTLERVKIDEAPLRVDLTLPPAHSLRGRIVDLQGQPIARANLHAHWSPILQQLTTDSDGRFEWKEAPRSGVQVDIYAAGFAGKTDMALQSDVDHEIVLIRPTVVRGSVIDRETGQPVSQYSLALAAAWKPGNPFIWQRGWNLDEDATKAAGSFEYTISSPADRYLLRVQADGYLPEDAEPFSPHGTSHSLVFRLTRAEPIRGTVYNPDGSPATTGFVYLVPAHRDGWIDYLYLRNDDVPKEDRAGSGRAKIGADGRFSLPPQKENFALLARTPAGWTIVPRADLRGEVSLRLQPWARVTGSVTIEGKPAANLELRSYDPEGSAPVDGEPRLVRSHEVKTDADGRFELPRLMAGRLALAQWMPNGVAGRSWPVVRATVDVESGQTYELKIGTSGRLVGGRLALPQDAVWMIRKAEIVLKDPKTARPAPVGIEILEEGRFRALDVKPGDYALRVALHEPPPGDACGWGRLLGEYAHEFTVPAGAATSDVPLDLGLLEPVAVGVRPLQVGDRVPDFALKNLDGQDLSLADFRGRYLLLDFWASWCAPCLAEMPNLRAIHDEFAQDPRFVLLGVTLDDRPRDAASAAKALKLSWRQGFAGPDAPIVSAYGATAIPATFLIGPDGKVLARDLRGDDLRRAVADALKP